MYVTGSNQRGSEWAWELLTAPIPTAQAPVCSSLREILFFRAQLSSQNSQKSQRPARWMKKVIHRAKLSGAKKSPTKTQQRDFLRWHWSWLLEHFLKEEFQKCFGKWQFLCTSRGQHSRACKFLCICTRFRNEPRFSDAASGMSDSVPSEMQQMATDTHLLSDPFTTTSTEADPGDSKENWPSLHVPARGQPSEHWGLSQARSLSQRMPFLLPSGPGSLLSN